jgi:hypothetical protein
MLHNHECLCNNRECLNDKPKNSKQQYCSERCKIRWHNVCRKSGISKNKEKMKLRKILEDKIDKGYESEELEKLRMKLIKFHET